jgi:hypothetical protein
MEHCCDHSGYHGHSPTIIPVYVPVCSCCGLPLASCGCRTSARCAYLLHQEIGVDPGVTEKVAMIGGVAQVSPVLDYMPVDGASSTEVKVVIKASDGTTTTIDETTIAPGYYVKDDIASLSPGSMMTLSVTGCCARLRWRETIEY